MNNKTFFKNNKGIAMVTIMITIMFLSIIASALLYVSASNYSMKVANTYGKANYYETDGILVKTTTALRNSAQNDASTMGGAIVTAPSDSADGSYNITKIANLVYPGFTGTATSCTVALPSEDSLNPAGTNDTITFKTNNNAIKKGTAPVAGVTRYIFEDIEVIQTSSRGYENSVKTDLILDVHEQSTSGGSSGGVGNMSMLLDSPLSSTNANFKNLTMTGNAFVADYGSPVTWNGATYIAPGANGLVMNNESRLNLCGTHNVIYGDLNLSGNSTLCVYGNLTVYGDIKVSGCASLIVADGGKLYQYTEGPLPDRSAISTVNAGANNTFPNPLVINPVSKDSFDQFADTIGIKNPVTENGSLKYGLITKIFKKGPVDKDGNKPFGEIRIIDASGATHGSISCDYSVPDPLPVGYASVNKNDFDRGRGIKLNNDLFGCKAFGFGFLGDDIWDPQPSLQLNQSDYLYRLMISYNSKPINLQQSTPFTTWIAKSPVTCSQAHCVVLSRVGTTQFNYMTAAKGDSESVIYNNETNPFNSVEIKIGSVTFKGKYGSFFDQNCNKYVDDMFGASLNGGSGGGTPIITTAVSFDNFQRDFDL